ncbi:LysR family transcriptional regulator substrate-binding protein [Nesterenkonia sp. F]|uniref:LysR family transcriptional regulator substrate-binding protein n=1 Tax=Nesterenkonia sp. F TaxID=795955 RepID=UPI000255D20A|nr:LysR family transcriptional regulator substrate-binding protein [Nesterenkonia sp. F]
MTDDAAGPPREVLRLGAIPGATPDKWAARWHARFPEVRLQVEYFDDAGQLKRLRAGTVDVGYLRLPEGEDLDALVDDPETFHRVLLYREEPVVCASRDHWIAAAEESVTAEDIAEESLLDPAGMVDPASLDVHAPRAGVELARAERLAMEVVASGAGLLVLPNSVARMLSRKDVVIRRLEDRPGYAVGLCWLRSADDEAVQELIGVARGRRAGSVRSAGISESSGRSAKSAKAEKSQKSQKSGGSGSSGRSGRATPAGARGGRPRPGGGPRPGSRRGRPPRGRRPKR